MYVERRRRINISGLSRAPVSSAALARCNTAGVLAGDESAARILSADNDASATGAAIASAYDRLLYWLGMIMATSASMSKQLLNVLQMAASWDALGSPQTWR
jgi:hypothetical protein